MSQFSGYRHMRLEDRKLLESLLNQKTVSLKNVALALGYSPKCVRYEITRHRFIKVRSNQVNKCGKQLDCNAQRLCSECISGLCRECRHNSCNDLCSDFTDTPQCKRTLRFPYVCSGCPKLEHCKLPKCFYNANIAQREYERDKTVWREGPKKSPIEMKLISDTIAKGVRNNQSLDVIIHTNELPISTATAYRYIRKRQIEGVLNLSLKRQVQYSPRIQSKRRPNPINYDFLTGRRYSEFLKFIGSSTSSVWEMDTVIGKQAEYPCLLTLLHRPSNLQLCFLLPFKTMAEVNKVFTHLKEFLGEDLFKETFPIILTDNGVEFHDPLSLETSPYTGEKLISIYFCEPRRSDEKAKCEKNHCQIRDLFPKGCSMAALTKKDVNYTSLMVNNYPRPQFNYHSPY